MSQGTTLQLVIIGLAAYLMGNINPAIILGKIKGVDIRKEGSGNPGMTNTIRVMGLGAGISVFLVDMLKGFIAVYIGYTYAFMNGAMVAFAGVVLGHCFPVVFGFKGGKGVATAFGAALALNWLSAIAALLVALVVFVFTRRMSIASLLAALAYPFLVHYYEPECTYFAIGAAVFLILTHIPNIKRIFAGKEQALTIGGKEVVSHEGELIEDKEEKAENAAAAEAVETVAEKETDVTAADAKADKAVEPEGGIVEDAPLTDKELNELNASDKEAGVLMDMESGESHIVAEATQEPELVTAQTQEAVRPEPEPMDYYVGVEVPDLGDEQRRIAVIGNGSFGTAMANLLAYNGHDVTLYGRNKEALEAMEKTRMNERYLPYVILSDRIKYTNSLEDAVKGKDIVVYAIPAQKFRQVSEDSAQYLEDGVIAVNLAKGIEMKTLKRMSEVAAETLPGVTYVALSGPSHAEELVRNIPAGVVVASTDQEAAKTIQDACMSEQFRVYTQEDLVGVEIAGSVKNVIAITTGISDGMKLGSNARAALMTRAIHEIKRMGVAMGANPETFSGLSGIGDLIVTCSTNLSRNRRCGLMIGLGLSAEEAVERVGSVVEGYYTADAVNDLAEKLDVEMPICKVTQAVLKGKLDPEKAVRTLMSRGKKDELK